jgi:hypothetical protein
MSIIRTNAERRQNFAKVMRQLDYLFETLPYYLSSQPTQELWAVQYWFEPTSFIARGHYLPYMDVDCLKDEMGINNYD